MLKELNTDEASEQSRWLTAFWKGEITWLDPTQQLAWFQHVFFPHSDFRRRFLSLLSYQFSSFHPSLALTILQNKKAKEAHSKSLLLSHLKSFIIAKLKRVFGPHSSQSLWTGRTFHPLWPETPGVVFEEYGGLSPHHGSGPSGGARLFPQAARWHVPLSCTVCKFPLSFFWC